MLKRIAKYLGLFFLIIIGLVVVFFFWADKEVYKVLGTSVDQIDLSYIDKTDGSILIKNVNVLAEDCSDFSLAKNVLLHKGIIQKITASDSLDDNVQHVIDGSGKFLIPGLVDSHVHLLESKNDLYLYLTNGVTHVREMAGRPVTLDWKKEAEDGALSPRLFICSPQLYSEPGLKGRYYEWSRKAISFSTPEEVEKGVNRLIGLGYDGLKMYGFVNEEIFKETTKVAATYDFPVVGHIPDVTLDDFYSAGQEEVAHIEELTKKLISSFGRRISVNPDEFLEYLNANVNEVALNLKKNDITVASTIWLMESIERQAFDLESELKLVKLEYVNPRVSEGMALYKLGWLPDKNGYEESEEVKSNAELTKRYKVFWKTYVEAVYIMTQALVKYDVPILAGTDANAPGVVPGFSLHDELQSLVRAGLSTSEALYAATMAPNQWMGTNAGSVTEGMNADLILLSENPLEDIANTRKIELVFLKDYVIEKSQITFLQKRVKELYASEAKVDIGKYSVD